MDVREGWVGWFMDGGGEGRAYFRMYCRCESFCLSFVTDSKFSSPNQEVKSTQLNFTPTGI